jgi:hypothetical protein
VSEVDVDASEVTPDGVTDPVGGIEHDLLEEELAMRDRLRADPNCLDEDMTRCSADIAYIGGRLARAHLAYTHAKIGAKKRRALAYLAAKSDAADQYGKGATVDVVNALTDLNADYLEAVHLEAVAEAVLALAKTNLAAAQARKDMLIQMASTRRSEMERDPVVRSSRFRDRPGPASG